MIDSQGNQGRRIALAAAITVIAIPLALLFGGNDESETNTSQATISSEAPTTTRATEDPLGDPGLAQFNRTVTTPPTGGAVIAVPDSNSAFRGTASFDYTIEANDLCFARGAPLGLFVTIVNLDNSRSTTCIAAFTLDENAADIVMHPDRFAAIGDPTDAPITVEYRW
ncbi:MAG: hypothetical protein EBS76_12030 [Actinobacteria bacterium]|nr:hypothetical protein [Actinomycetota bacterium]